MKPFAATFPTHETQKTDDKDEGACAQRTLTNYLCYPSNLCHPWPVVFPVTPQLTQR